MGFLCPKKFAILCPGVYNKLLREHNSLIFNKLLT